MKQFRIRTGIQIRFLVMGLWLVLAAIGIRMVSGTVSGSMLDSMSVRQMLAVAAECVSVPTVTEETASQVAEQPEKPPKGITDEALEQLVRTAPVVVAAEEAPLREELSFTQEEADAIAIGGSAKSAVDRASLLLSPLMLKRTAGPQVLVVHTHTTEAYTPTPECSYKPSAEFRTLDPEQSIVRVGDEICRELERCGVETIHDTTCNDDPEYAGAYDRSSKCIAAQLAAHPSIQIVLDIHRDAAEDEEGNALAKQTLIDGERCAQLMLVVGTDEGGLEHPNWENNLSFALKLQALLSRSYPTLCRDLSLRTERFNQHYTPCSLLVEVGAAGNTLEQALPSARYLAQAIARLVGSATETEP